MTLAIRFVLGRNENKGILSFWNGLLFHHQSSALLVIIWFLLLTSSRAFTELNKVALLNAVNKKIITGSQNNAELICYSDLVFVTYT